VSSTGRYTAEAAAVFSWT